MDHLRDLQGIRCHFLAAADAPHNSLLVWGPGSCDRENCACRHRARGGPGVFAAPKAFRVVAPRNPRIVSPSEQVAACGGWLLAKLQKVRDLRSQESRRNPTKILVVAPHMTFLDSLVIAWAFPPVPSGVGMTDILKFPLFRSLTLASQAVFVARDNPDSRQSCKEVIQTRASKAWTGPPMMIFPEGVLTNGKTLIQFKAGAFVPGVPVTPVCLRYPWRHYNPCGCGKNYRVIIAVVRTLLQFANFCEISILDNYTPSEAEVSDAKLYAEGVRSTMARHLKVPVTEHSYEDASLNFKSRAHVGLDFEVSQMKAHCGFTSEEVKAIFARFEEINTSCSGRITWTEFEVGFFVKCFDGDLCITPLSKKLIFDFMDQDSKGSFGFREFLQLAAMTQGKLARMDRLRLGFLSISKVSSDGSLRARHDVLAEIISQVGMASSPPLSKSGDLEFLDFAQHLEHFPAVLQAMLNKFRLQMGLGLE
eukprot:CAMPEP_0178426188 /NCGR_PEP_ID=MMETSP0689_2-20121128/29109_1 /TAXON_ID=160604 /ORGANISM="Amphidinium massartii, Strain CS-259" /LENGTH=477 /DNA_ID=CAMNT_0020047873 /DNA_START=71 /DNA_END=1505 /DNA_ORIENTATION=+